MIDRSWGDGDRENLNISDVVAIRESFADNGSIELLAEEYKVSESSIARILYGDILPYAGGPLIPLPLQGCNPKYQESTRNRQRFVREIIKRAKEVLATDEYEVFCNFNGMRVTEANKYIHNSEDSNERLAQERYSGVICRHAAGASIEESVIAHARRARVNPAKTERTGP